MFQLVVTEFPLGWRVMGRTSGADETNLFIRVVFLCDHYSPV